MHKAHRHSSCTRHRGTPHAGAYYQYCCILPHPFDVAVVPDQVFLGEHETHVRFKATINPHFATATLNGVNVVSGSAQVAPGLAVPSGTAVSAVFEVTAQDKITTKVSSVKRHHPFPPSRIASPHSCMVSPVIVCPRSSVDLQCHNTTCPVDRQLAGIA